MMDEIKVRVNRRLWLGLLAGLFTAAIGFGVAYLQGAFFGRISLYSSFGMTAGIVLAFMAPLLIKTLREQTFACDDSKLIVSDGKSDLTIPCAEIRNYNVYPLVFRNLGYIVRVRSAKNYCFWICNAPSSDETEMNQQRFRTMLAQSGAAQKKDGTDRAILFLSLLPLLLAGLAILTVLGIFIWIMHL